MVTGRWADKEIPAVFQPLEKEKALGDLPELSASGCWDAPHGRVRILCRPPQYPGFRARPVIRSRKSEPLSSLCLANLTAVSSSELPSMKALQCLQKHQDIGKDFQEESGVLIMPYPPIMPDFVVGSTDRRTDQVIDLARNLSCMKKQEKKRLPYSLSQLFP